MLEKPSHPFSSGLTSVSLSPSAVVLLVTPSHAAGWQDDVQAQFYIIWSMIGLFFIITGFLAGGIMNIKLFTLISLPISAVLLLLSFLIGSAENVIGRLIFASQIIASINGLVVIGMLGARCFLQHKTLLSDREHA
jgi:hypothetical protein